MADKSTKQLVSLKSVRHDKYPETLSLDPWVQHLIPLRIGALSGDDTPQSSYRSTSFILLVIRGITLHSCTIICTNFLGCHPPFFNS